MRSIFKILSVCILSAVVLVHPGTTAWASGSSSQQEKGTADKSRDLRITEEGFITLGQDFQPPLQPDKNVSLNHFNYNDEDREYWLYVPDTAMEGSEESKLILALHGSGSNGFSMMMQTGLNDIAAEENVIVIYPNALKNDEGLTYWSNTDEELSFLLELVDKIKKEYKIDESCVYGIGFSNGAGMIQNLAIQDSAAFAAVAACSPAYFDEEYYDMPEYVSDVAIMFSCGTLDSYALNYGGGADVDSIGAVKHLEYWRNYYSFSQEDYTYEREGLYDIYTFYSNNDLPVCQWVTVNGKKHEVWAAETERVYDFLSQYRKVNGRLVYNDSILVEADGVKNFLKHQLSRD